MKLTPFNVDILLHGGMDNNGRNFIGILPQFLSKLKKEGRNLWFGHIKIEDADIPRKARSQAGFISSLYIGGDVNEEFNFSEYLAIRHQILLGFNIPSSDKTNTKTRRLLWDKTKELQDLLEVNGFLVSIGPEDIPATDIRILIFTSYTKGSPSTF